MDFMTGPTPSLALAFESLSVFVGRRECTGRWPTPSLTLPFHTLSVFVGRPESTRRKKRGEDSLEAEGVLPWTKEIEANGWKTAGSTQASQKPAGKSAGLRWRRLMWKTISLSLSPSMEQGSLYVHGGCKHQLFGPFKVIFPWMV